MDGYGCTEEQMAQAVKLAKEIGSVRRAAQDLDLA